MKHNLLRIFCATFLLCFYSATRSQTSSYQCYHQESEDSVGIETYLPLRSYNGVGHTPQGDLKMMLVFVTFIEDDTIPGTDNLSSVWPKNSLPVYASGYPNNLLDSSRHYPSGYKNLTRFFQTMSMYDATTDTGFSVSGNCFKVQINKTIFTSDTVNLNPKFHLQTRAQRLNFLEQLYCQRAAIALQTTYPNTDWSKFDKRQNRSNWQFNNNIHYRNNGNVLTTAKGDSALDYVNFSFRLSHDFIRTMVDRGGQAGFSVYGVNIKGIPPLSRNGANYRFNIGHTTLYVMGEEEHFSYFLHEFCHSIFTREHYMGANTSSGDHFYTSYGWGIMSEIYRFFLTANAWEKWFLGWMNPQRATPNQTVYVLKDFVTANDALRIPIPNSDSQSVWIENHQLINTFDNKLTNPEYPVTKGLYIYITDYDNQNSPSQIKPNRFKVLSRGGNKDVLWSKQGTSISFQEGSDNPISGQAVSQLIRGDFDQNGTIGYTSHEGASNNESERIQSLNNQQVAPFSGSSINSFQVGDELGLSGIQPTLNYPSAVNYSYDGNLTLENYELNGINIKVLSYNASTGEYTIQVLFDDYELRNSKRWTGTIDLYDNTDNTDVDLILKSNKTLTINKSGTVNTASKGLNNTEFPDFVKPSILTCKSNSFLKLESNSTIQVYEGSTIKMEPNSKLEIENGAKLIISDNSKLDIASNAQIIVHPGGKIIIDDGSSLVFNPNVNITLHNNSFIEVAEFGKINIAENATFTWSGKGYLKINTNTWGVSNIVATGPNAKFQKTGGGYGPFDEKLVEITGGGSLSVDKSLAEFKLQRGYVLMDEHTLLDVEPKMRCYFVKFTTNDANKKHAGIMVYGQQNEAYLDNCIVENAGWGILMLNNSGNATQAKIVATKFINNEIGVYIHGKGADLSYCTFWRNTHAAIQLDMLTLPANLYKINAEGNGNGLLSNATNFSLINITDSKIYQNLSGVQVTGGTLTVGCSKIYNNYGPNLHIKNQTTLGLEPARWAKTGNNYFYNDFTTSIELNNAWSLFMDKGKNHFQVNPNYTSQVINGTLRSAGVWWQRAIFPIVASQNYWNLNGTSPVMQTVSASNDYLITQKYRTTTANVSILDGSPFTTPPTFADCGSGNSLPYNPGDQPSVLIGKPNLTLSNSIDIKDYFMTGLDKLYIQNDYESAISIFELIVKHDYGTSNDIQLSDEEYISEQGLWSEVVYAAYEKMLEGLTSGIHAGVIGDYQSYTDSYEKVMLAQEHLIGNMIAADTLAYEHWFKLSLDNAIIYKLMGNLNTCYNKLDNLKAASFHTSTNANLVNYTLCRVENEISLRDSVITKMDYATALNSCISELGYTYPTTTLNVGEEPADPSEEGYFGKKGNDANKSNSEPNQLVDEQSTDEVNVYPNPSDGLIIINANGVKVETITIYNKLGMKVATYNNTDTINISQSGLFILEIKTNKGTYRKKVVVQ